MTIKWLRDNAHVFIIGQKPFQQLLHLESSIFGTKVDVSFEKVPLRTLPRQLFTFRKRGGGALKCSQSNILCAHFAPFPYLLHPLKVPEERETLQSHGKEAVAGVGGLGGVLAGREICPNSFVLREALQDSTH